MSEDTRTLHRTGESRVIGFVQRETYGISSALEFGCGVGVYTREMMCPVRAGIDGFLPYIEEAQDTPENNGIDFIFGDMCLYRYLVPREYEAAMFIDSIEHLHKSDAYTLIERCQADFKKIIVFIPIGVHEQEPCDNNELQRHLSTWSVEDLQALGFDVKFQADFHHNNPLDKQAAAFALWRRN